MVQVKFICYLDLLLTMNQDNQTRLLWIPAVALMGWCYKRRSAVCTRAIYLCHQARSIVEISGYNSIYRVSSYTAKDTPDTVRSVPSEMLVASCQNSLQLLSRIKWLMRQELLKSQPSYYQVQQTNVMTGTNNWSAFTSSQSHLIRHIESKYNPTPFIEWVISTACHIKSSMWYCLLIKPSVPLLSQTTIELGIYHY